jgi:hypothetical protein
MGEARQRLGSSKAALPHASPSMPTTIKQADLIESIAAALQ